MVRTRSEWFHAPEKPPRAFSGGRRELARTFRVAVIYSFGWYRGNIPRYLCSRALASGNVRRRSAGEKRERKAAAAAADSYVGSGFAGTRGAARGATRNLRATRLLTSRRVP